MKTDYCTATRATCLSNTDCRSDTLANTDERLMPPSGGFFRRAHVWLCAGFRIGRDNSPGACGKSEREPTSRLVWANKKAAGVLPTASEWSRGLFHEAQDVLADLDAFVCVFETEDQVALGHLVDGGEGPVEKEA